MARCKLLHPFAMTSLRWGKFLLEAKFQRHVGCQAPHLLPFLAKAILDRGVTWLEKIYEIVVWRWQAKPSESKWKAAMWDRKNFGGLLGTLGVADMQGAPSDLVDALKTGRLRKSGQSITFPVALLCSCVSRRACMVLCILFSMWLPILPPLGRPARWEIFVSCQNSPQKCLN